MYTVGLIPNASSPNIAQLTVINSECVL